MILSGSFSRSHALVSCILPYVLFTAYVLHWGLNDRFKPGIHIGVSQKTPLLKKKNVRKKKVEKYEHEKTSASGPHRYLASHSRQLKLLIEEE